LISIPASGCDCEHMFLELGEMLEPRRRKLSAHLIAAIQCIRAWRKHGFRRTFIREAYITYNERL
ncbi:hypothetical protein K469DRAFT_575819, partial [Zopfia rhizophila CBS 207.26]